MRGVVMLGDRSCRLHEFPDPEPGPGEVRVKMMATGICGSDLHTYRQTPERARAREGRILGHEPCGVVDAVGIGVTRVKEGERVTVYHRLGCGHCPQCAAGRQNTCPDWRGYGGALEGSFADYVLAEERSCIPLGGSLSFVDGAFIACPAGTAYSALRKLDVKAGDCVVVVGLGPVGLSGVRLARAMGAEIIGVDLIPERLELGRKLGAGATIAATDGDPVAAIRDHTGGRGAPLAFETSGSPKGRDTAVRCLRLEGKAAFVGGGNSDKVINPGDLIARELTLMGSCCLPLPMAWELVQFFEEREISMDEAVTHRFALEDAPEAFRLFDEGRTGKVVFEWS
ncbi:MAG: alcohol dehydrogenase catalytic domain-containing protein [Armatimonadota bacterium]|jgi:threonine dehydrogenase-like Zn-dependent dehydrogenase